MIPCPVCGEEYREGKICPKQGAGKAVCISCCKKCNYQRTPREFNRGCGFYSAPENQWLKLPEEVTRLTQKGNEKLNQANRFYKRNKPWVAEKLESEAKYHFGLARKLQEDYDERRKAIGI